MNTEKIEVTELLEDGTVKEYVEDITTTSGKNGLVKVVGGLILLTAAGVGALLYKKKKDEKTTEEEIKSLESKGYKIFKSDEVLDVVQVDVDEEEDFEE